MNWRVLVVALAAVAAGCGGIVGNGGDASTVTPAPVPTSSPTPEDPRVGVAPGLSADGTVDVRYLAQHHVAAARDTSYVWWENESLYHRYDNISINTTEYQRVTYERPSVYHRYVRLHQIEVDQQLQYVQDYEEYGDGSYEYHKWIGADQENTYRRDGEANASREYAALATGPILRYLDFEEGTVREIDVGEQRHFEVVGTRSSLPEYSEVSNYTARAVIREDGFVRSLNVTYSAARGGEFVESHYTFAYRQVGSANVTEPDWVDEAREEVGDA